MTHEVSLPVFWQSTIIPEKAKHFCFHRPVAQELLVRFKPVQKSQNEISKLIVLKLAPLQGDTLQGLPASHVGDITILDGGDPLELTMIPHRLLQRKSIEKPLLCSRQINFLIR